MTKLTKIADKKLENKKPRPSLQVVGGSRSNAFNRNLIDQALQSCWYSQADPPIHDEKRRATLVALAGIKPSDEIEGMLAAQMVACHHATMDSYRRAAHPEQPPVLRHENLADANKLSRTYTAQMEALQRYRGKGQQRVTVEHVHVHQGGQAIVGNVERGGGGKRECVEQPHASGLAYTPGATVPGENKEGVEVPSAGDEERQVSPAWRQVPRSAEG